MTRNRVTAVARTATKLIFPAVLVAVAVQVSGLVQPRRASIAKPIISGPIIAGPIVSEPMTSGPSAAKHDPAVAATPAPVAVSPPSALVVKRVLQVAEPIRLGQWYWDDAGVPAGRIVITADIAAGTLSVFRDGYEIGTAAILYGADDKPTPLGVFPITQKDATHRSNLYDAPMPYMLRMTGDGVSIHGSDVKVGKGTNGCIGVPVPFAKLLFGQAKLGDPVIVTDGRMIGMGGALRAS